MTTRTPAWAVLAIVVGITLMVFAVAATAGQHLAAVTG